MNGLKKLMDPKIIAFLTSSSSKPKLMTMKLTTCSPWSVIPLAPNLQKLKSHKKQLKMASNNCKISHKQTKSMKLSIKLAESNKKSKFELKRSKLK